MDTYGDIYCSIVCKDLEAIWVIWVFIPGEVNKYNIVGSTNEHLEAKEGVHLATCINLKNTILDFLKK